MRRTVDIEARENDDFPRADLVFQSYPTTSTALNGQYEFLPAVNRKKIALCIKRTAQGKRQEFAGLEFLFERVEEVSFGLGQHA